MSIRPYRNGETSLTVIVVCERCFPLVLVVSGLRIALDVSRPIFREFGGRLGLLVRLVFLDRVASAFFRLGGFAVVRVVSVNIFCQVNQPTTDSVIMRVAHRMEKAIVVLAGGFNIVRWLRVFEGYYISFA